MMVFEINKEARAAALAGTRVLILEETFDALVGALIASGAIPQNAASVMLDHLAERFIAHSDGRLRSEFVIDRGELRDQAARLKLQAALRSDASGSVQ